MTILPLHPNLKKYLKIHGLEKKFAKQKGLFEQDYTHPSLHTELLEPKKMKIYSFRVDKKYRAVFIYIGQNVVEIVDINPHYA